jgi:hypothetical protein
VGAWRIDADCESSQRSSQIYVDQDELNLVLPEAITSVARGDSSSPVVAENHPWEFAWQTITLSYRMTNGLKRVFRFLAKEKLFTRLPDRRSSAGVASVEPSAHRVTNFVLSSDASKM